MEKTSKNYLLLSLGHNSSAIYVYNSGKNVLGYEQERLSEIKADSQFPYDAICEIIKHVGLKNMKDCSIRISHWFDTDAFVPCKYITRENIDFLQEISDDIRDTGTHIGFTHHDAHAWSAYSFYLNNYDNKEKEDIYCLVVDGFGNEQEVISLYKTDPFYGITLIRRVYGYENSLGLMYQYATSFCGMKENQDEYKFLGYEAHLEECINDIAFQNLTNIISKDSSILINKINFCNEKVDLGHGFQDCINFRKLIKQKEKWHSKFAEVIEQVVSSKINYDIEYSSYLSRCIIGYYIQGICENVLSHIVKSYEITNLIVTGGVFYNVKLNHKLLNSVSGKFCAMPLAGDQGAVIGMYVKEEGLKNFNFGNLCWGKRSLYNAEKLISQSGNTNIHYYTAINKDAIKHISDDVADGKIVNIIVGNMEFGPRALCHTSTLFIPTSENTEFNNFINGRNEVMPCAPVCTEENAAKLFEQEIDRIVGSCKYMICTSTYKSDINHKRYAGVMHKIPFENKYTGRPQIAKEQFIIDILNEVEKQTGLKALVNTSFNVHGRPIAFDITAILQNFEFQCKNVNCHSEKLAEKLVLYIIKSEK